MKKRSQSVPRSRRPLGKTQPKLPYPVQHQKAPGREKKLTPAPRWRASSYRAAGKLEGKVALITGGDSGIGRAVAYLFAREGADVAINFLPSERPDALEVQRAVEALGRRCLLVPGDLASPRTCPRLVEKTLKEFGKLDILVSNAAHQQRKDSL
jgi:hypothetical protein